MDIIKEGRKKKKLCFTARWFNEGKHCGQRKSRSDAGFSETSEDSSNMRGLEVNKNKEEYGVLVNIIMN